MATKSRLLRHAMASALFGALVAWSGTAVAAGKSVTIGTGSSGGVYIALGNAICEALHKEVRNIKCTAVQTKGSLDNLIGLKQGKFDLGIVQSDIQYQAMHGTGVFTKIGALPMMRSMFSAHAEALALMVKRDSDIRTFDDLVGKRVNIGKVTSGTNATMRLLFSAKGWKASDFKALETLDVKEQDDALRGRKVDATAYLVGHPNAVVDKLIKFADARFVPIAGPEVDRLIAANPYSIRALISKEDYDRMDRDVPTFGLLATVMATDKTDPGLVYQITRAVFENLNFVRSRHTSFRRLNPLEMARLGMTAPYHPGAQQYLKESGRLP